MAVGLLAGLALIVASASAAAPGQCLPADPSQCGCDWTDGGSKCGPDDGSDCYCRCCCPYTGSCQAKAGGGGGGGGGSSGGGSSGGGSCAMPAGVPTNPMDVDNTNFVACHGKLRLGGADGLQLVDEHGEAVQLMGMSSHGLHWFGNCYTKESIAFLVENWGINLFRAAMYVGEGGYATDASVKDLVKDIVQWCKELGIYVMIDWHMLTPGNPNAATYSGAEAFWTEMATLYKDEVHVLYETANEPNGVAWPPVKGYHNRMIRAIRAVDEETIIICGTPTWSQDIHLAAADPVDQPHNVMYTFHFYAGTHMSLLSRVESVASQIPLFATEWGTSRASGDGGPFLDNTMQFLNLFKKAGSKGVSISFAQWSYADKGEVSAALKPGACGRGAWDDTSCSGTLLRNYIKSNVETCSGKRPPTTRTTPTPAMPTPKPRPATPSPMTAPAAPQQPRFERTCAKVGSLKTGNKKMQVLYALGTVDGEDAIMFTVRFPSRRGAASYGSIGFRDVGGRGMTGLDLVSFDSATKDRVQESVTVRAMAAPEADPMQDSVLLSHRTLSSSTMVRFYRKLVTGNDFPIVVGQRIGFGWAFGEGSVFDGSMGYHAGDRGSMDVMIEPCAGAPQVTPKPPMRTAMPTMAPVYQPMPPPTMAPVYQPMPPPTMAPVYQPMPPPTMAPVYQPTRRPTTAPVYQPTPRPRMPSGGRKCGLYQSCTHDASCCRVGECVRKDYHYSQCRMNCPRGWDCESGVKHTPHPVNHHGTCHMWSSCGHDPMCCRIGKCMKKDDHYSQCRKNCPPGWACSA